MRKIFSSQRVETAEGVAQLLRDAGIEVRLSNGRSYKSRRSGQFSYSEASSTQNLPTVWVVRADEQTRAREILREARLLDTTRHDLPAAQYSFRDDSTATGNGQRWAWRIRISLLLVIGAIAMFVVMRHRNTPVTAPQSPPAAPDTQPPQPAQDEMRVRIQPAR
jgi:hypothetical protein